MTDTLSGQLAQLSLKQQEGGGETEFDAKSLVSEIMTSPIAQEDKALFQQLLNHFQQPITEVKVPTAGFTSVAESLSAFDQNAGDFLLRTKNKVQGAMEKEGASWAATSSLLEFHQQHMIKMIGYEFIGKMISSGVKVVDRLTQIQ